MMARAPSYHAPVWFLRDHQNRGLRLGPRRIFTARGPKITCHFWGRA